MIVCGLCPHRCALREGQSGLCRARKNVNGINVALNYGRVTSLALDPVEKKPLMRFHPGAMLLSVGGFGCNMRCFFCQNAGISFCGPDEVPYEELQARELADMAAELAPRGCIGAAFTYNEPLLNHEYIRECAALLRERGMKTVLVTNGCFHLDAVGDLLPLIDAMNVDLKGFTESWYRRLGGDLPTVKAFIAAAQAVSHVEVTTLVVPGENDTEEEIAELAAWLASLRADIPLHVTRFFPRHKAQGYAATDPAAVRRLAEVARGSLRWVYAGNV
ncbi:MAG TPA: AmmeMemoRadiSam system radical SAM enzyme [Candidatus Limnocylindria bacterium]|nr:AmmeMemoRadiSam system radical SAM enzyme [Candidatus Limnocylindria bacterium]